MAKVKIEDNTMTVYLNKRLKASTFLSFLINDIVNVSKPKTPKKDGDLRAKIIKQVLGTKATLIWNRKYAQYQERGMRRDGSRVIKKYTTPGTGANFAQNAVNQVSKNIDKYVKQAQL